MKRYTDSLGVPKGPCANSLVLSVALLGGGGNFSLGH
jgi:hypothetical protein